MRNLQSENIYMAKEKKYTQKINLHKFALFIRSSKLKFGGGVVEMRKCDIL